VLIRQFIVFCIFQTVGWKEDYIRGTLLA